MPRRSREQYFSIVRAALAMAEERGSVPLGEIAGTLGDGMTRDELALLLEPVLYLEYRLPDGTIVHEEQNFLLNEDDELMVTEDHWLRSMAATPPSPEAALRLLVAGSVFQATVARPDPGLERALYKLERLIAAPVVVDAGPPPLLKVVVRAFREKQTLCCRYTNDRGETRDREIEPWQVFSNWGRWYLYGRDVTQDDARWFRVDRMSSAEVGDLECDPPEVTGIPEEFDLHEHERVVRLRLPRDELEFLPTPHRLGPQLDTGDGTVEVDVTIWGDQRVEHLLVVLPPEAEVVSPVEYTLLRREHAARLLSGYGDPEPS